MTEVVPKWKIDSQRAESSSVFGASKFQSMSCVCKMIYRLTRCSLKTTVSNKVNKYNYNTRGNGGCLHVVKSVKVNGW